jgi:hypothetical protein
MTAVELEPHRHHVRLAVGGDGGDAGQSLRSQIGDLLFAERHSGRLLTPGAHAIIIVNVPGSLAQ